MKNLLLLILIGITIPWINPTSAQPIVKVKGTDDSISVSYQVHQFLEHLDIHETIHLTVAFTSDMPDKTEGMTFVLDSPEPEVYQIIKVWISSHLNKVRQKIVIAHEMIHVKQYVKGELSVVDQHHVIWKGHKYSYQRAKDRRVSPWEHEAYRNDQPLANLCKDQLKMPLLAQRPKH